MCKVRGVGIDLCEIARMEPLLRDDRFLARYFTPDEAAYIRGRGASAAQSLAGLYAAKEAVLKALGTGLSLPLGEIEVTHSPAGQPLCRLSGSALERAGGGHIHLSISHEGPMAAAFAVFSDDGADESRC